MTPVTEMQARVDMSSGRGGEGYFPCGADCEAGATAFAAGVVAFDFEWPNEGRIPAWLSWTTSIKPKMPAIMRQTNSIMMPSMPLASRPLVMDQMMPKTHSSATKAQMALSSSVLDFGFICSSLLMARLSSAEFVQDHQAEEQRDVCDGGVHEPLGSNVGAFAAGP